MGSKSKSDIMKSNNIQKRARRQKNQKKENAQDIISKSVGLRGRKKSRTINKIYDRKLGITIGYSMGSKSKTKYMKSYETHQKRKLVKKSKKGKCSGYDK